MTYSSTNPIQRSIDIGLTAMSSVGGAGLYTYSSTHNSTDILATGFFTGVGAGSRGSLQDLGVRVGDILINRSSTTATPNGRVTIHQFIASSADQASTTASTGWVASYNMTVSQSS
jgi:hypothetical protein